MKPRSKIPIGLVALTLASIALALLVFWSFQGSGLSVGSNINRPDGGGAVDVLSPATFIVFILSLLATYWIGRESGRFWLRRSKNYHEQLVDESFLRAKASLESAAQAQESLTRTHDRVAEELPTRKNPLANMAFDPGGWMKSVDDDEQVSAADLEPDGKKTLESDEIFSPLIPFSSIHEYGPTAEAETGVPGRRRLSTTELMSELSPESRQLLFGRNDLQSSPPMPGQGLDAEPPRRHQ